MEIKAISDVTRDGEVSLTHPELIRTKSTFKKQGSTNASTILKNSGFIKKTRVRFETSKNEIIYIESFKSYNAENVFTEALKKIHCKCNIY